MVSWWPGDGNAHDIRDGNNPNGSFGTAQFVPAKVAQGMKFDGSNGYIVADNSNLNFGTGSFSIDGWIRVDALPGTTSVLVEKRRFVSPGAAGYVLSIDSTGSLGFTIQDGTNSAAVQTTTPITDSNFHQIAMVVDRTNSNVTIYLDGVLQQTASTTSVGSVTNTGRLFIGHHSLDSGTSAVDFNGVIDELEIFNSALTQTQIQAIVNAGSAGKCRSCVTPPPDMVGWWPGDGNPNDIQNGNNGTLQGGATFAPGEVAQAFSFNASTNSGVIVPSTSLLNPTEAITIDAWVKPSSFPNTGPAVVRKDSNGAGTTQYSLNVGDGVSVGVVHCNIGGTASATGGSVPLNQWSHVACTYDRQTIRVYVNGDEVASTPDTQAIPASAQNLAIGKEDGFTDRNFDGLIDEVEIFSRALTAAEIAAIADAGNAGKCKPAIPVSISGTVLYCSNPVPGPVPNVTLTLTGTASGSTLSDGSGNYTFSSLPSGGNYTVTPTKAARVPGSRTSTPWM